MTEDRFKFRVWSPTKKIFISIPWYGRFHNSQLEIDEYDCYSDNEKDSAIIEQCTGLRDKNGKLIYEGDILDDSDSPRIVVIWRNGSFGYDYMGFHSLPFWIHELEIIGNIHEEKWGIEREVKG